MTSIGFTAGQRLDPSTATARVLGGAYAGVEAAGNSSYIDDLIQTAGAVALARGFDQRTFTELKPSAPEAAMLRGLVFGTFTPMDRQRLRRDAAQSVLASTPRDELVAVAAATVAVLAADLSRGFSLGDCTIRCRQTLLEEAPEALLDALTPLAEDVDLTPSDGPISAIQIAITACTRHHALQSVISSMQPDPLGQALAGALAALESGGEPALPPAAGTASSELAQAMQSISGPQA